MEQHADLHQRVACRPLARGRAAFASQSQDLTVPRSRRDVDIQRGAVRKDNRLLAAIDGIKERKLEMIADVLAPPAAACAAGTAENLRENIFAGGEIAEIGKARIIAVGGPTVLIGEIPVVLLARPLRARGVDFSAVKARPLVRIAE